MFSSNRLIGSTVKKIITFFMACFMVISPTTYAFRDRIECSARDELSIKMQVSDEPDSKGFTFILRYRHPYTHELVDLDMTKTNWEKFEYSPVSYTNNCVQYLRIDYDLITSQIISKFFRPQETLLGFQFLYRNAKMNIKNLKNFLIKYIAKDTEETPIKDFTVQNLLYMLFICQIFCLIDNGIINHFGISNGNVIFNLHFLPAICVDTARELKSPYSSSEKVLLLMKRYFQSEIQDYLNSDNLASATTK